MDDWIDAQIEDTYQWVCPRCKTLNSDVAGNDEVIECECGFQTDPDSLDWDAQDCLFLDYLERMLKESGDGS